MVGISGLVVIACLATAGLPSWFLSLRPERTVTWQGQLLLEEDLGFLDPDYVYYAWCGPLVRGLEPLELGLEYGQRLP